MWVVFQKSDGKVVGTSTESEIDFAREEAFREVVAGLPGPEDAYDALQIKERGWLLSMGSVIARGHAVVREGKDGELEVVDQTPATYMLLVTTDAKEFHPVDGTARIAGER